MLPHRTLALLAALVVTPLLGCAAGDGEEPQGNGKSASSAQRVFELRTYYANPGKLDALNARFRNHTNRIFKSHGIEIIGFWTPQEQKLDADGKGARLIYLLAFPSREAAMKSWKEFRDDPDWKKAKDASEKDGVLVEKVDSVFLDPTDYSPIK